MSAHSLGTPQFNIRHLAFIVRGLMRGLLTSMIQGPLIFLAELGANHPDYLQDPLWIGGTIGGLAVLILVLRWFGEGGILRGSVVAFLSLGFFNGVGVLICAALVDVDEALGLAIIGTVLVLICGFILQRMERHRYG